MRLNDDGRTVAAMDLLVPGGRRNHRREAERKGDYLVKEWMSWG